MLFRQTKDYEYQIIPEKGEDIKDILLTIAAVSYNTAIPRGRGHEQAYLHSADKGPNLEKCIEVEPTRIIPKEAVLIRQFLMDDFSKPIVDDIQRGTTRLVMDYINGRDCRTMVMEHSDGKWYFHTYAFLQRKMESNEFMDAVAGKAEFIEKPEEFLKQVNQRLAEIKKK